MTELKTDLKNATVSRRTVAKGVAWAAPAVALASAAPAFAVSLRKDPGINGWVNSYEEMQETGTCGLYNFMDGRRNQPISTPDDAPTGLYIYDIEDTNATFGGAAITIWVPGRPRRFSYTPRTGHSRNWVYAGSVGTVTKPDGLEYTGYKFSYTGTFDMSEVEQGRTNARVWLEDFNIAIEATYPISGWSCRPPHRGKWVQREITVDRDGDATRYDPEYFCFQRPGSRLYACDGAGDATTTRSAAAEVQYGEVL